MAGTNAACRKCPETYVAAVGDANDPATWSGIPYHFLSAGRKYGLLDDGLNLAVNGVRWTCRRGLWNVLHVLGGRKPGGYQYQACFLERLYSPMRQKLPHNAVINCFQMYPPSVVRDDRVEKWFYIDMTLQQLFECYGANIDPRTRGAIIARERDGYRSAAGVITHSRWAADSVMCDYDIPGDRVHAVVPGANIDDGAYSAWESSELLRARARDERELKLVFVGRCWKRKGLDRLLDAFRLARSDRADITLRVIGLPRESAPEAYRGIAGVQWFGLVDKSTESAKFLRSVAECDVGCLLSRSEAGGISLREFHALGLATLGPDVGGAPEHMIPGASIAIPVSAPPKEIAEAIIGLHRNRSKLERMRATAWQGRHTALWDASVERILGFWPHAIDRYRSDPQTTQDEAAC
jgi:glycosyltransferase involved in cell wall biosynthesis